MSLAANRRPGGRSASGHAPVRWLTVTSDSLPSALLWDMDGTLVDTEPYWMAEEAELIASWGGTWTADDALQVVGMGLWDAARIFQSHGVGLSEDEIVTWMTARVMERIAVEVPWRPGARELLRAAVDAGVPCALVTMSVHAMAESVAGSIGFAAFDVIVGGDDVSAAKPHPAPYLLAAELLGVSTRDCVAFEDSRPGVASAVAAGAATIALPLHTTIAASDRYTVWPGLDGKSLDDVAEVLALRRAAVPR